MAKALGMRCISLSEELACASIPYQHALVGDATTGVIHGGVVSTLLDHSCGLIAFAVLGGQGAPATLDLRIDYYRPATPDRDLIAEARPSRVTSMIAFVEAIVHNGNIDDPVARAHAAMMLPKGALAQAREARRERGLDAR